MAKITRVLQKIFGSTANAGEIGKFGSLAAGSPTTTTDPAVIQSLSNYLDGWYAATVGQNSPAIQDVNALDFLWSRQLAYLFQAGISEWETGTTYYTGSLALSPTTGLLYQSKTDNNQGNALTNTTNWRIFQNVDVVVKWSTSVSSVASGGGNSTVKYTVKVFDPNNYYDATTGMFTVPFDGIYEINAHVKANMALTSANNFLLYWRKNGSDIDDLVDYRNSTSTFHNPQGSSIVAAAAGDTINVQMQNNTSALITLDGTAPDNFFSIKRIGNA